MFGAWFVKPISYRNHLMKKKSILISISKYIGWFILIVTLAILFRIFIAQVFYIPSSSMNSTLYEGDVILVNEMCYGALLPNSLSDIPILSNLLLIKPIGKFMEGKQWHCHRSPGICKPKRGDVVVFFTDENNTIFIKRCIALPADTLFIMHDTVYINDRIQHFPDSSRLQYRLHTKANCYSDEYLKSIVPRKDQISEVGIKSCLLRLTISDAKALNKHREVNCLEHAEDTATTGFQNLFPYKESLRWNCSNYGPIVVPKKGRTVKLNIVNLAFYEKIIRDEDNTLDVIDDMIFVNRQRANSYTFKKNYYFMMGDNRLNSSDSRFRGVIAEDKIIGKATLVLFSKEMDTWKPNGFRKDRMMKKIK